MGRLSRSPLLDAAVAVHELLLAAGWCRVELSEAFNLPEVVAKLSVELVGRVTHHVQATATLRSFRSECCDQDVAARLQRTTNVGDVLLSVRGLPKEMEYCSVVPKVMPPL
ncbi:MAG: hypothetical protein ACOZQL_19120 [Myxococcota bacterium]